MSMQPRAAGLDQDLVDRVGAIVEGAPDRAGALTSTIQAIHESSDRYDWTGIYLVEGDELVLHDYRGGATPHARIPRGKGLCGVAADEKRTVAAPDVKKEARYLERDAGTAAEIVVPIGKLGYVFGLIDVESRTRDAFGDRDRRTLEAVARRLAKLFG